MDAKVEMFFCQETNASVTAVTCEARKKHAQTMKGGQLSMLYALCKDCERKPPKKRKR